jgi:hypothetical protein
MCLCVSNSFYFSFTSYTIFILYIFFDRLLPYWVPFHPGRMWCHCRVVYLPMAYLYGTKSTAKETELIRQLRQVPWFFCILSLCLNISWLMCFFVDTFTLNANGLFSGIVYRTLREDWLDKISILDISLWSLQSTIPHYQSRFQYALHNFSSKLQKKLNKESISDFDSFFEALFQIYEKCPLQWLRKRAITETLDHIRYEDIQTHYIDIGPVHTHTHTHTHTLNTLNTHTQTKSHQSHYIDIDSLIFSLSLWILRSF